MHFFKSSICILSFVSIAFARSIPYTTSDSTASTTPTSSAKSTISTTSISSGYIYYATNVLSATVTTCGADETIPIHEKPIVVTTPSILTVSVTSVRSTASLSSSSSSSPRAFVTISASNSSSIRPSTPASRASSSNITSSPSLSSSRTLSSSSTRSFSSTASPSTSTSRASSSNITSSASLSSFSTLLSSSTRSSSGTASLSSSACAFWLADIKKQGIAAFNGSPGTYKVFRNVQDFGAKGDGVTDDTAAINNAISSGGRCGPGSCASTTTSPAIVYFPPGTYLVSSPIIDYYYTQIIGNPNCMPIIKAAPSFSARWFIDGDQYQPSGLLGFGSTNVFWRQIRNLIIDMTAMSPTILCAGIHWPTAQATSLQNIVFKMSSNPGTQHEGIFIESGSGGFMTDLTFFGGLNGATLGNQQFTMRNLTFFNSVTAINQLWDWGWTYKGISINNCSVGLSMAGLNNGALSVGSVVMVDSDIRNTPVGVVMGRDANSMPSSGNSLILENVRLSNVPIAVQGPGRSTVLAGSSGSTLVNFGQGHSYTPTGPNNFQSTLNPINRRASLVSGTDYYARSKPQYEKLNAGQFLSARDAGATGNGVTDDSDALNALFSAAAASGKVVFIDAGDYLVLKTVTIPAGSKIVGETYPVILSSGTFFSDINNPKPVVAVGKPSDTGVAELSDLIVSTKGAQAGAILIQWNLASPSSTPAGMWDVHTRIGGFAGSGLQISTCPTTPGTTITSSNLNQNCIAAFMSLHVTKSATGLYMENVWLWVADHDVEDPNLRQITIYAGRGLLIESQVGAIWLVGTSVEHHSLYQYQLSQTKDIFMGQIQTETAYYQPNPDATIPFSALSSFNDPTIPKGGSGLGLRLVSSSNIFVYGAGLYSFFTNNNVDCSSASGNKQSCQTRIFSVENSQVVVYNLDTIGVTKMITLDGVDIADYQDNDNGFVKTIALFRN